MLNRLLSAISLPCLQAGVAPARSVAEVAQLEHALCLLIRRAADIQDAKSAQLLAEMDCVLNISHDKPEQGNAAVSNQLPAVHAEHAQAANAQASDDSATAAGGAVSASSELITPEIERLLPSAARRVSLYSCTAFHISCGHAYGSDQRNTAPWLPKKNACVHAQRDCVNTHCTAHSSLPAP